MNSNRKLIYADRFKEEMYHEAFERDTDMQRWDSGCWIRYKLFERMLEKQPAVNVEPQWISCNERLPDKDGYYLTTTCYRQVYCDFWNEDHFDRTEAVIAWMLLPEPYEGKE